MIEMKEINASFNKQLKAKNSDNIFPLELIQIKLLQFTDINNKEEKNNLRNQQYFFDKISNKHIVLIDDRLLIFNFKGNKQIAELNSPYHRYTIHFITLDVNLTYCITIITIEKQKLLIAFSVAKNEILGVIKITDYDYLLGLFIFRTNKDNDNDCSTLSSTQEIALVYVHKIVFYPINHFDEIIDQDNIIEVLISNAFITNYSFKTKCNILCCQMNNNTVSLYDLSNQKLLTTEHSISFPKDDTNAHYFLSIPLMSLYYSYTKDKKKEIALNYHSGLNQYSKSQYFVEKLYIDLYLVVLSYENSSIKVFQIQQHEKYFITLSYQIDFELHSFNSTLQFIDNMIISYNLSLCEVCVFDLKTSKENYLLYYSSNFLNNTTTNLLIEGKCIRITNLNNNETTLYYVSFDLDKYYNVVNDKEKYKALIDIMRRNKSFNYFKKYSIQTKIPYNKKTDFMKEIVALIWKTTKASTYDKQISCNNNSVLNLSNEQKYLIQFLSTLYPINFTKILIHHLLIVYYTTKNRQQLLPLNYYHLLIEQIKQLDSNNINQLLQSNLLPKNKEILHFLISLSNNNLNKNGLILQQNIMDLMTLYKFSGSIFALLYKKNCFTVAFLLLLKAQQTTESSSLIALLKETILQDKVVITKNKKLILQYIQNNDEEI